jgi:hypothetical protein
MKRRIGLLVIIFLILSIPLYAQQKIEWQHTLGGDSVDQIISIIPTSDGGFATIGFSMSDFGDILHNHGGFDVWVVKLSQAGIPEWQKLYGGSGDDQAGYIIQTSDGGFAFCGFSNSPDGDVHGLHGTDGSQDVWFVKLSSTGAIEWEKTIGGTGIDLGFAVVQDADSAYCFAGSTASHNGDFVRADTSEYFDLCAVKLDKTGNIQWSETYGGSADDYGFNMIKTSDGAYAICGYTNSHDGDVQGQHGGEDAWVVKLSASGGLLWQHCYGGSGHEEANTLIEDSDHGLTIAGWSNSSNGDLFPGFGDDDLWVFHTDSTGSFRWGNLFGGSDLDEAHAIIHSASGGYIIAGHTESNDVEVTGNHGSSDVWVIEVSSDGGLVWQKTFGGSKYDHAYSVVPSSDGTFVFAGYTESNDGDVSGLHGQNFNSDGWVVKLSPASSVRSVNDLNSSSVYPNPSTGLVTMNYELKKAVHIQAEVYDLLGVRIALLGEEDAAQGANSFSRDLSYLSSGQYILSLRGDSFSLTKPFIITK